MRTSNTQIQQWLNLIEVAEIFRSLAYETQEAATSAKRPENTRPATPEDITLGNILWFDEVDDVEVDGSWVMVEEVNKPNDQWKGFDGHDGCRYGYDGLSVEIFAESKPSEDEEWFEPDNRQMQINIKGSTRSGKTTVAQLIALLLRSNNINVTSLIDDNNDTHLIGDPMHTKDLVRKFLTLADKVDVSIEASPIGHHRPTK